MRYKAHQKILAAGLAFWMAVGGNVPNLPNLATLIKAASDTDLITFLFHTEDGELSRSDSIVAGESVTITVNKSDAFNELSPAIDLVKQDGSNLSSTDFSIGQGQNKDQKILTINSSFMTPDVPDVGKTEELTVRGNYYAVLRNGTVDETTTGSGIFTSDFTISTDSPALQVYTDSSITIRCTQSETDVMAPQFEIVAGSITPQPEEESSFAGYEKVTTSTSGGRNPSTTDLALVLQNKVGANNIKVSFPTKAVYTTPAPDQTSAGMQPEDFPNAYVQAGTTFKLSMAGPKSDRAVLTVYSPVAAARDIGVSIRSQDGVSENEQEFIELAEGDDLNFIRNPFKVLGFTSRFHGDFYIEWKWEPTNPADQDVVVTPDVSNGKQNVNIVPKYDDVTGILRANIFYGSYNKGDTDPEYSVPIQITIKGTGQPPTLEAHSQKLPGQETATEFTGDDRKMPQIISLDAYDGHLAGVKLPDDPYQYTLRLKMGKDGGAAVHAVVEQTGGTEGLVTFQTTKYDGGQSQTDNYTLGGEIANTKLDMPGVEDIVDLVINPVKTGVREYQSATFKVQYYVYNANKEPVLAVDQPREFTIRVKDSSPSDDKTLNPLILKARNGPANLVRIEALERWEEMGTEEGFQYDPAVTQYQLTLPNRYEAVKFFPTVNDPYANKTIYVRATCKDDPNYSWDGQATKDSDPPGDGWVAIKSGGETTAIPLVENAMVRIELWVTAEDTTTQTYTFDILRKPKGSDPSLKSLKMTDVNKDSEKPIVFDNIQPNVFEYDISVPFRTKQVKLEWELNDPNAPELDPEKSFSPSLISDGGAFSEKNILDIVAGCKAQDPTSQRRMTFMMETVAENGTTKQTYVFHIFREDPSEVNTLDGLTILEDKKNGEEDAIITYTPTFHKDMDEGDYYEVNIPYSVKNIKVSATPTDLGAYLQFAHAKVKPDGSSGISNETSSWVSLSPNTPSKVFTPEPYDEDNAEYTYYEAIVEVWPESTPPPGEEDNNLNRDPNDARYQEKVVRYPIHIYRAPPNTDATLSSIVLTDQDNQAVPFLDFEPETFEYALDVDYEVRKIVVTPTATDANVTSILVNSKKVNNGQPSKEITLEEKTTTVTIVVTAEDGKTTCTYKLAITRSDPSNDARLVKLEVQNIVDRLKPVFNPDETDYTAEVAEGAEGVIITPTANHPKATIEVDGKRVESGQPSELIRILKVKQKVNIVVTAQDGKTTRTYTINFRNNNLVEKTDNADLESLDVTPGSMQPTKFKSSVTTYEVAVDEETYDVMLDPVPADSLATMKVYQEGKEIGDDDGNYGGYIEDGENEFTIEVTSPDKTKTKTYTVLVYRNEEDKMGKLTPIEAEDIDFENSSDVIIVDISKYSRVGSSVFEELKNWPEKTIIFQGNDYSLQFRAKDLPEVIPHTDAFDFGMSFRSPEEDDIIDEIYSHSGNRGVDFVMIYFKYHGDLPGPATLNFHLGNKYADENLYWNCYNSERDRIDYYGRIRTNSKGTFSVKMTHMSTWIVSRDMFNGANNVNNANANLDLSAEAITDKLIPNTGAEEDEP